MTYTPDTDSGVYTHEVRFTHTPTGVQLFCQIQRIEPPGPATEAQKDAVFQAFVSKVAELAGVVITSATKTTLYTSQCSP